MHTVFGTGSLDESLDEPMAGERPTTVSPSTVSPTAGSPRPGHAAVARVAVAGATGYAGQEALRLLARHPAVTLTAAMSSGTTASNRRLPALAHVWDGQITP